MRILAALIASALAVPAQSHEFWIEPLDYQIEADGKVQAMLVNGQEFEGTELGFIPQRMSAFLTYQDDQVRAVENRIGARPALDEPPMGDGLQIFRYESRLSVLTYSEWEKFLRFAAHKDFEDIEARHDARGLPREGFQEGYWRFAKSLIGVGSGEGADMRTGLPVEYVALDNPYTDDLSAGMRLQLFILNEVGADRQVELFEKAPDGSVEVTLHRTGEDGIVVLPVKAGHSYLVDHVVLRTPSQQLAEDAGIEWETLWAALTFAVPAD